jgi:xylulokinase
LIGIDIGTTAIKAVIYSVTGEMLGLGTNPNRLVEQDGDHPTWTVWNPDALWDSVCSATKDALRNVGAEPVRTRGVAVTGLGQAGLPIGKDGKWLYPIISTQDSRTSAQHMSWKQQFDLRRLHEITGYPMLPFAGINRIMWIRDHEPRKYAKMSKWLMIEDYVAFRLSKECFTDYTIASTTSAFDQANLCWSEEVFLSAGLDIGKMAQTCPSGTKIGAVSAESAASTGLEEGTPVVSGAHDYFCAALGSDAFDDWSICDASGTWEIVSRVAGRTFASEPLLREGLIFEAHAARDMYGIVSFFLSGGLIEWFKEHLGLSEREEASCSGTSPYDALGLTARRSGPGSSGVFLLPYFNANGGPPDDPMCRGALFGLTSSTTRADIIHSLFEGLSYELRRRIEAIERCTGIEAEVIKVVGGVERNELWLSCKADIVGKPVRVTGIREATALGAAMLAGVGSGVFKNERDAVRSMCKSGRIIEPNIGLTKLYSEYFETIYSNLYGATQDVHRTIGRMFPNE